MKDKIISLVQILEAIEQTHALIIQDGLWPNFDEHGVRVYGGERTMEDVEVAYFTGASHAQNFVLDQLRAYLEAETEQPIQE